MLKTAVFSSRFLNDLTYAENGDLNGFKPVQEPNLSQIFSSVIAKS